MKTAKHRLGIILAAGRGTRFSAYETLTGNKHLTTIDGDPLIVHGVRHLQHAGTDTIIVAASPNSAAGYRALLNRPEWSAVEIVTIPTSQGTPDTLEQALSFIKLSEIKDGLLVLLGDNFFVPDTFPYEQAIAAAEAIEHGERSGLLTLVNDPLAAERAVVCVDEAGIVQNVKEKPKQVASTLTATGFYVLPLQETAEVCQKLPRSARGEKETGDLLQALIDRGVKLRSTQISGTGRIAVDRRSDVAKTTEIVIPATFRRRRSSLPVVCITGIAGFIGSCLARELVQAGYSVCGVDDLSTGYIENLPPELQLGRDWIKLDLTARSAVARLTRFLKGKKQPGNRLHIVHTACPAYDALSNILNTFVTRGVTVGTAAVLSTAVNVGADRFINLSSMARYEAMSLDLARRWTGYREDDPTSLGMSPYGNAKLAAEKNMRMMLDQFGIPWTNLVFHNVIGVGQQYDNPARNVASMLLNMALHGKPMYIYGSGAAHRVYTPWSDVAFAITELVTDVHGRYDGLTLNIGPGAKHSMSVRDLCSVIARVTARVRGQPLREDVRSMDAGQTLAALGMAFCNDDRYRGLFGRSPEPDIEKTLTDMANAVLANEREFDYRPFRNADLPLRRIPAQNQRVFRIRT